MSSIIVAAPPIWGETQPMLQMAAALVRRGHDVTALLGSGFADAAVATGARFVALEREADYDVAEVVARPDRLAAAPGPEQLNWDHIELFVRAVPAQHRALQALLGSMPDASLVCNSVFFGAWPTALGAPGLRPRRWIAVVANPIVMGDDLTTPFGPSPGLEGDAQVAANREVNAGFEASMAPTRAYAQQTVDALDATQPMPAYVDGLYTLPDAVVALTVPELDFPRRTPPPGLRYGGALPIPAAVDGPAPTWWDDLDRGRPVVVVTQGTVANGDLTELVEPTLLALADRDVLVVAALGRDPGDLGIDVPANARVERYVPFDRLLPKAAVLVTNGGFGGVQQALAQATPVVVAGTTEDKPMVAAQVAFRGVGVDLGTQRATRDQISGAVDAVLGDAGFAEAARAMSAAYAGRDPIDTLEELLGS